ncbi:hypothetical protein [Actinokineospora sp. NBRC 105648]|uniref:hypothetical protein n=1 Tax=Actinokineospora sp. NBRC 105648 TaxID=3032206 RepID=UPI0024A5A13D|nr:hypothetical protein [Actinokineospora sp. NBRC 105648]GLZ41443.1 hypothetical protein Acsp05_50670 [Actinokineospora sp. NBRC 105648]
METSTTEPRTGRLWLFLVVWLSWFAIGFPYTDPTWRSTAVDALIATGGATLMVLAVTTIGWWQHRPKAADQVGQEVGQEQHQ